MPLKLYNSYTKRKEKFRPRKGKTVTMYNCGPTVYDYAHIGNLRSFLFADVLRRYLEYRKYRVKQVMNITDVGHMTTDADAGEDKMSVAMRRKKMGPAEVARFYEGKFFEDIDALGFRRAWKYPRATEHVPEMVRLVEKLLKRRHAYLVCEKAPPPPSSPTRGEEVFPNSPPLVGGVRGGGCSVYYDLSTFPKYGKLSGNRVEDLIAGARVEVVYEKRNPYDFALWIYKPGHILQWQSPWGAGYPGWHLECSAMSMKYLGETLDIHTGGEDNKFPHHECEIAQSEGATGKLFARYWLHVKHLLVDGNKMSKSLGNFYTLRDLAAKGYAPREVRYALIAAHYRETLNFTLKGLEDARRALARVDELVERVSGSNKKNAARGFIPRRGGTQGAALRTRTVANARKDFIAAMDDDLNVPKALGVLFNFVRKLNRIMNDESRIKESDRRNACAFLRETNEVLGLGIDFKKKKAAIPRAVRKLAEEREEARKNKDWTRSDKLRAEVENLGYTIEDTQTGPQIRKI